MYFGQEFCSLAKSFYVLKLRAMDPRRYVICDIEATGLDENKDIIEIALITYQDDKIVDVYDTLINPMRSVPEFIQQLTSISHRDLQTAPKFYEVADAIRMRLEGSIFVSHNTDFDFALLKKKFEERGESLELKTFCTLKVAQHEIPGLKSYSLDALSSFFRIKNPERHRAVGDARATLELFVELLNLKMKFRPRDLYLPEHEKFLSKIPGKSGLLLFKDAEGKLLRRVSAFRMDETARKLLLVKPENKFLLEKTESVIFEETGSELIAEFRKLLYEPHKYLFTIVLELTSRGEKTFIVKPFKKGVQGLWFFENYKLAKEKLQTLNRSLKKDDFAYREGGRSKEEILRHNKTVDDLLKEVKFPNDHLLIMGPGRSLGEKSLILIRDQHVQGFGYSTSSEEDIIDTPEAFLLKKFSKNLNLDLAAIKHLRVLKNSRHKDEGWRSLSEGAR